MRVKERETNMGLEREEERECKGWERGIQGESMRVREMESKRGSRERERGREGTGKVGR
jgi:hypothetical protein